MKLVPGKFSFKVPEGHAEAGKKIEKGFEFQECETQDEAQKILTNSYDSVSGEWKPRVKPWSLVDLVNDTLKLNARANAYQSATLVYRPSEVSQEDIKERMVRDAIRLGMPEDIARQMVDNTLAALKPATTEATTEEVPEVTPEG